jgi:hypothetical protein
MTQTSTISRTSTSHFGVLGVCWIAYSVICLIATVWLLSFTTTATLMYGALLTRVPDPYTLMSAFHFLYLGAIIWSAASGALGILAGVILLTGQDSARTVAIIAALISLPELPLGVIIGVYTLVVLVPAPPMQSYVATQRAA